MEGNGVQFRGESWKDLMNKVRDYRARNNIPVGNVEEEVWSQYCARMPQHCQSPSRPVPPANHHSMTLNQRVLHSLAKIMERRRKAAIPRVEDREAQRRAEICKACPFHKPLVRSCEACVRVIDSTRKAVLESGPSQHQNLLACAVLGEDLPLTVHIEQPTESNSDLPPNCWRK